MNITQPSLFDVTPPTEQVAEPMSERPAPFSPEWTRQLWQLRKTHPDMTDDEWLEGFWGPHITALWREGEKFWAEMRRLRETKQEASKP